MNIKQAVAYQNLTLVLLSILFHVVIILIIILNLTITLITAGLLTVMQMQLLKVLLQVVQTLRIQTLHHLLLLHLNLLQVQVRKQKRRLVKIMNLNQLAQLKILKTNKKTFDRMSFFNKSDPYLHLRYVHLTFHRKRLVNHDQNYMLILLFLFLPWSSKLNLLHQKLLMYQ